MLGQIGIHMIFKLAAIGYYQFLRGMRKQKTKTSAFCGSQPTEP
jgi:hypothetical protein